MAASCGAGSLPGTLPLRDVDGAFTELEHSLDTMRADGMILLGNYADAMVEAHRYLESSGQFGKIVAKRLKQAPLATQPSNYRKPSKLGVDDRLVSTCRLDRLAILRCCGLGQRRAETSGNDENQGRPCGLRLRFGAAHGCLQARLRRGCRSQGCGGAGRPCRRFRPSTPDSRV